MATNYAALWIALPFPAFVVDGNNTVCAASGAAEQLTKTSAKILTGRSITQFFEEDSLLMDTISQVRTGSSSITQYHVNLTLPEGAVLACTVQADLLTDDSDNIMIILVPTGSAEKMSRSLTHMSAARSVTAMSAMLAHEIRNPLAGISGAAQLLAMNASDEDKELTGLIGLETKRIGQLVDRVEHFGDQTPTTLNPVNIHDVLDRVVLSAKAGFGRHVQFTTEYDPSLPETPGDADQLLQIFQNIVKNATESVDKARGTIKIRTSYQSGVKLSVAGSRTVSLPLQIEIIDNGRGIPPDILPDIFEPFVTTKANGTGLGLPLVSKFVSGHGGLIECDSLGGRTTFRVRLPIWKTPKGAT